MNNLLKWCLALCLGLCLQLPSLAQDEASEGTGDSFDQDIIKLQQINGSAEAFRAVIPQLLANFKSLNSKVPAEVWDELEKEFANTSITDLQKLLVPVYRRHFSQSEIRQIIAFYETPAGKKMAEKAPLLQKDSYDVGSNWGKQLGEKVAERLKAKGY
ncbi:MAG: DUF2059 domain-containing protein [Bernardetiaceae bacterium]|jgi:hypothetical protein|nr:DUF2059 domain-containing protein [Bernardetiaceae bacterium]